MLSIDGTHERLRRIRGELRDVAGAWRLRIAGHATLTVYDALGRRVAVLVDGNLAAGRHGVRFDGANLPSGNYLVRLEAGSFSQTRNLTLLK